MWTPGLVRDRIEKLNNGGKAAMGSIEEGLLMPAGMRTSPCLHGKEVKIICFRIYKFPDGGLYYFPFLFQPVKDDLINGRHLVCTSEPDGSHVVIDQAVLQRPGYGLQL